MTQPPSSELLAVVHKCGYVVVDAFLLGNRSSKRAIAPVDASTIGRIVRVPGDAYRRFAAVRTEVQIASFANDYGFLGCAADEPDYSYLVHGGLQLNGWTAESVMAWRRHSSMLRKHVRLWDAVKKGAFSELSLLVPHLLTSSFLPPLPQGYPVAAWSAYKSRSSGGRPTLLIGQEMKALRVGWRAVSQAQSQSARNRRMRQLGWSVLGLSVTAHLRANMVIPALTPVSVVTVQTARPRGGRPMAIVPTAHTLIGALWIQLAVAVTKGLEYRQCAGCGGELTIHPSENRTNRRTCSDACRSKVYRANNPASRRGKK